MLYTKFQLPGPFEQTFIPPSQRVSIWNLAVVFEEKTFFKKSVNNGYDNAGGQEAHQWAFGLSELIIGEWPFQRKHYRNDLKFLGK